MKLKTKSGFILTAVLLMLTAFSFTAFANATQASTPTPTEELSVNDNTESKTPLSPKGNMTSIDDVHQITDTSDKDTIEDKQFITVESKNGNVFYIIIDRSSDTDNVYFLNAVDEADLMALLEDEQKSEITAVCTCTDKCELGDVDETCPICSKNISKCIGKESVQDDKDKDKDKDAKEETKQSGGPLAGLLILAILGAGGALYWFKFKNKKSSTKGTTEPEEYYEDDESEEDEENEEQEVITDDEEYDEDTQESEDDEE